MTTTRGIRNNNPGNIRHSTIKWFGAEDIKLDNEFVTFKKPEYGIRAIVKILSTYYRAKKAKDGSKIDTVKEVIDRWAPPIENNTNAYSKHVAQLLNIDENKPINLLQYHIMYSLVLSIIHHENGTQPYSAEVVEEGLKLGGITNGKFS